MITYKHQADLTNLLCHMINILCFSYLFSFQMKIVEVLQYLNQCPAECTESVEVSKLAVFL